MTSARDEYLHDSKFWPVPQNKAPERMLQKWTWSRDVVVFNWIFRDAISNP